MYYDTRIKKIERQVQRINTSISLNLMNLLAALVRIFFALPSFVASSFISVAFIRLNAAPRSRITRIGKNRRKTMKSYESEHCGWFHEGFGTGESMRAM